MQRVTPFNVSNVLLAGLTLAVVTTGSVAQEETIDHAITGLRSITEQLSGTIGWRLVFHHEVEVVGQDMQSTQWTCTVLRQGDNMLVERKFDDGRTSVDVWHDGVGIKVVGGVVTVSPSFDLAMIQIVNYTNYLSLDISPKNARWDNDVTEVVKTSSPSELLVWALPRMIEERRGEYQADETTEQLVQLRRADRDEILLDPSRGFACVARNYYLKKGVPLTKIENSSFRKVAPGLWLPETQVVRKFNGPPKDPSLYGKLGAIERNKLLSFEFLNLTDTHFQPQLPESGYVFDRVRKLGYRRFPAGTTPEQAMQASIDNALAFDTSIRLHWKSRTWLMLVVNVTLASVFLVAWRKRALASC